VVYNTGGKKSSELGMVEYLPKVFKGKGSWWGGKRKGL